jgi:hypothetical protein
MSLYELQAPTEWHGPPSTWSSSSVDEVEACPRRYQFLRSRWGELDRFPLRPQPAAIEGQIVHEALDRLTRACGQRGNPGFGSVEFSSALSDADFFAGIARSVAEWQQRLASHPRPGPAFRLRVGLDELTNRAVRMFRQQYREGAPNAFVAERAPEAPGDLKGLLKHRRALSEVRLGHPRLPFLGIIDRVEATAEGVEIVDFKTGRPSEKHQTQLLRYALLWWRNSGNVPFRVTVQYLGGAQSLSVENGALEDMEASLAARLPLLTEALRTHPAPAEPGPGCHLCAVRARCGEGWKVAEPAAVAAGRGDAELRVIAGAGDHGFIAHDRGGREVAVVYEAPLAPLLPAFTDGRVLRITDGVWNEKGKQLEIKAWTEVFVVLAEAS